MSKLWLSEGMIAESFWKSLRASTLGHEASSDAREICSVTAPIVDKFPAIAGSIDQKSCESLWLITKYFSPRFVLEVGTYIGRSTLCITFGGRATIEKIYTCDGTFDCLDFSDLKDRVGNLEKTKAMDNIRYFGKTMSHEVLEVVIRENMIVDMVFIDGRISTKDCDLLLKILSPSAVIVLDDFEGVEKGVVNAMMLRGYLKQHILLEPEIHNDGKKGNQALLIPSSNLSLSRQQRLPVNM